MGAESDIGVATISAQPNATTDDIRPNPLATLEVETLARHETGLVRFCREVDHSRAANRSMGQQLGTSVPAPLQLLGRLAINPKQCRLGKQTQERKRHPHFWCNRANFLPILPSQDIETTPVVLKNITAAAEYNHCKGDRD